MTSTADVVAAEREALCDLFLQLGPDSPTLCGDWTTRDLAAHLVVRERRPDSGPGIVLGGPFAAYTEKVRSDAAKRSLPALVDDLRGGPPIWWAARWIPAIDVVEWFVHHEDVRRPVGLGPRELPSDLVDELWNLLGKLGGQLVRSADVGIELETTDGRTRTLKKGDPSVIVRGDVGELVLRLYGRTVAEVEVNGTPEAVEAFERASFGI